MNDLATIVRINERVKQVTHLSDKLFIVALNAMFQARRAKASGFNTVTSELRKFSAEIAQAMKTLNQSIESQIEYVARHHHKRHFLTLVQRLQQGEEGENSKRLGDKLYRTLDQSSKVIADKFMQNFANFNRAFEKAQHACDIGHSLFIHAKVEAQSSGDYVQQLLPVVEQIENSVVKLDEILGEINKLTGQLSIIATSKFESIAA